jgi:hypothetical protein
VLKGIGSREVIAGAGARAVIARIPGEPLILLACATRGRDHTPGDVDRGLPINSPRLGIARVSARATPLNNKALGF